MFQDDLSLRGKHALVCGASSGIGHATALALASLGAEVTVLARTEAKLRSLLPELKRLGASEARVLAADLDDLVALKQVLPDFVAKAGPVHILINNTGGPPSGPILDAKEEDFLQAFSRHVLSAHTLVKNLLPGMKSAGYGRIINVVSTSVREPIVNLGVSNTIRGAMASWAKSLSNELPAGVTINNILPGYTATERLEVLKSATAQRTHRTPEAVQQSWIDAIPEGRLAAPAEIANAIAFLASPAASYVRGVSLPVDGGRLKGI